MSGAVAEILRYHHPNQQTTTARLAWEDVEIRDRGIGAGEQQQQRTGRGLASAEAARELGRSAHVGLVNAVLRQVPENPFDGLAVQKLPRWLRQPLVHAYGREVVAAIEAVQAGVPPLDLTLKDDGAAPEGEVLPTGSLRLAEAGQVSALAGFATGDWWVQDAAAALAVVSTAISSSRPPRFPNRPACR